MANLATFDITDTDYVDVATTASISFVNGTAYEIQGLNGDFMIRVGGTGKGFYVKSLEHVRYTYSTGETLYIKKMHNGDLTVNIG